MHTVKLMATWCLDEISSFDIIILLFAFCYLKIQIMFDFGTECWLPFECCAPRNCLKFPKMLSIHLLFRPKEI